VRRNALVSFKVVKSQEDLLANTYTVQVTIKGKRTHVDYPLDLKIIYHRLGQRWKFVEVRGAE
jgi:hypothetical protein